MLWLALTFPRLPLEAQARESLPPLGIVEAGRLCCVNGAAGRAGISPGMTLSAGRSLLPELQLLERQPFSERKALIRLAGWSLQYTSHASVQAPDCLLLELRGSLRLFGGLDALLQHIHRDLEALGYSWQSGLAPTPTGAWLLARANDAEPALDMDAFRQRLPALPVGLLPLETLQRQALKGLGIHTLEHLLSLPSRDLAPRLGRAPLLLLERALGQRPDPRPAHCPDKSYHGELELPAPAHTSEAILFALQRLIRELTGLLRGLEAGVQRLELVLDHRKHTPTRRTLGFMQACRDEERLLMVCRERLDRLQLPAPVIRIGLHACRLLPLAPEAMALLDARMEEQERCWRHLAERLEARLGEHCVQSLGTRPDHRPEHAWCTMKPGSTVNQAANPHRPLWLLATPQRLSTEGGLPCWQGTLVLHSAPERIESGWWDGKDISRDYYQAHASTGALLWIFRERRPPRQWFLHGFFG